MQVHSRGMRNISWVKQKVQVTLASSRVHKKDSSLIYQDKYFKVQFYSYTAQQVKI